MNRVISGVGASPVEKGINAGQKAAKIYFKSPQLFDQINKEYMVYDNKLGKMSLDSGIAFSRESLKALDQNTDGKVSIAEFDPSATFIDNNGDSVFDINKDGFISSSEDLALNIFMDVSGKKSGEPSGVISKDTQDFTAALAYYDPEYVSAELNKIYAGLDLGKKENEFDTKYNADGTKKIAETDEVEETNETDTTDETEETTDNDPLTSFFDFLKGVLADKQEEADQTENTVDNQFYYPQANPLQAIIIGLMQQIFMVMQLITSGGNSNRRYW